MMDTRTGNGIDHTNRRGAEERSGGAFRSGRSLAAIGIALLVGVALAGCVPSSPAPTQSSSAPTPTATPTVTPTPLATFDPAGTAEQNLLYFQKIGHAKFSNHPNIKGKSIIDDLVAAGFDKKDMEITPDKTSIGLAAWNIEFSVKMNGTCLIGQAGNVSFQSFAAPLLSTGKCLIGTTRKIDW
jgi:hypothetical protein